MRLELHLQAFEEIQAILCNLSGVGIGQRMGTSHYFPDGSPPFFGHSEK